MRLWAIALITAAGLGMAEGEALADRGRHNHSSASRHHPHSRPHPDHHRHHVQPHRRHHHSHSPRVVIAPVIVPRPHYYAPAPVYVAPPPVVVPAPVVPSPNSGYWYFCPDNRLYYPYALECPSGWLRVLPQ